jgi:exopolyphosphatase/guanosine-5'-triphosphate,3'-diphosphate pyrophosphatase
VFGSSAAGTAVSWRKSFDVGSVRLTERLIKGDPAKPSERNAAALLLRQTFSELPAMQPGTRLVGVAGTVTTLLTIAERIDPYDSARVHGTRLSLETLRILTDQLFSLPLAERQTIAGLQPKRADVIPVGALILTTALEQLGAAECWVSDRGLRWGLLQDRF